MRKVILLFGAVLASFAFVTAAPSPSAAAARDCHSDGSGNPGCRIVQIRDGRFSVPQVVASASLWLQIEADESTANTWLILYYEGTFRSANHFALGGAIVGGLLTQPGDWLIELRTAATSEPTSGELLDMFRLTLRSG
jgi:hypothetical protein